jgi:site-specific recombinase XerD
VSALHEAVDDYIAMRRSLGFKLQAYPWMLHDLVDFLESHGESKITTHLALEWAQLPGAGSHLSYLGKRLCVVRGFARHLQAFDPDTEVPAAYLMGWQSCRAIPYIYSEADIEAVMSAARSLKPELRSLTYRTLVGLLFVTGARVGEMIRLDRDDIGWDDAVVVIRYSKFDKSRELPVHPSTLDALRHYAEVRDRLCREPKTSSFFVNTLGRRLAYETVHQVFNKLTDAAGLRARSSNCRPRLHDIRHSLACATLIGWYRAGVDVQAQLPVLSAWLGHAKPENSYWYLSAVPELLALAGERRQQHQGGNRS